MAELGEQVFWKGPGLPQQKLGRRWRLGRWFGKAKRSDENLIANADGVHIARSTQRRLVQHCWSSQEVNALVGTPWEMMPKTTMLKQPRSPHRYITRAMVQKHGPYLVCRSCHVLPGGHSNACRSRFELSWPDEGSIEATAEAEKDARQASSSPPTTVNPSVTQPASGTSASSSEPAADTTASAVADQAAVPV